ncbi:MAG TPA: BT_3928 family protein, partial [Cyclobacteriaceae bacterium]
MLRKAIDQFSRFFVGGLFIFSGLIKLNDPIGTEIKLEEYFEVFATDFGSFFELFIPYALELGLILIVLEIVLGVAVLINYRMGQTTVVLLGLLLFFTFLTFYSAYYDAVTDCGCFGDAIKLTPWESFYKDLILMVFVLHLFWHRKRFDPVLRTMEGHAVIILTTAVSFFAGIYAIRHLPFIDFRAYKIGNTIPAQMKPEEQPIIEFIFEKNGEEVRSQEYLPETEGYAYKSSHVLNEEEATAKITDYAVSNVDGEDVTQQTFTGAKLLIIIYDVRYA